jgi:hypothetical protein
VSPAGEHFVSDSRLLEWQPVADARGQLARFNERRGFLQSPR